MKRIRKLTTAFLVIALLVTSLVSVPAFADGPGTVTRIGGDNRYLTAIEVSKTAYPTGAVAGAVIIASGQDWPDALAGSALAAHKNAPILLAKKDMIHAETLAEIKRLGVSKAIILGGPEAIGASVEGALKAMTELNDVYRIGGSNRFETATFIAGQLGAAPAKVYLASSEDYADALAIGPMAYKGKTPVLLTKADKLNATTKAYLATLGSAQQKVTVTIVGGVDAISEAVEAELGKMKNVKVEEERLAGENRWETSVKIAEKFTDAEQIVVALGNNFPDALVGGYFAGSIEAPIVLVKGDSISESVDGFVWASDRQSHHKWIIGGKDAIKPVVETDLKNIGKILKGFTVEAVTKLVKSGVASQQLKYTINGRDSALYDLAGYTSTFLYTKNGIGDDAGLLYSLDLLDEEGNPNTFEYQVVLAKAGKADVKSARQKVAVYDASAAASVKVTLPKGPIYLNTVGATSDSVKFTFVAKDAAGTVLTAPPVVGTPTTTGKAKAVLSATEWVLRATEAGKSKITFKFGEELTADIEVEVLADLVATTVEADEYKAKVKTSSSAYVFANKFVFFDQDGEEMTTPGVTYEIYNANGQFVSDNKLAVAGKYTIKIWNGAGKQIGSFPLEAINTEVTKPDEIKIVFEDVDDEEFENTLTIGQEVKFEIKAFYDGVDVENVAGYKVLSSDATVVSVDTSNKKIKGLKHGTATLKLVKMEGTIEGETVYTVDIVVADPQVTAINFVAPYDKVYFTGTVDAAAVATCTDVRAAYIQSVEYVAQSNVVVVKIKADNGGKVFTLPAVDHAFLNGNVEADGV